MKNKIMFLSVVLTLLVSNGCSHLGCRFGSYVDVLPSAKDEKKMIIGDVKKYGAVMQDGLFYAVGYLSSATPATLAVNNAFFNIQVYDFFYPCTLSQNHSEVFRLSRGLKKYDFETLKRWAENNTLLVFRGKVEQAAPDRNVQEFKELNPEPVFTITEITEYQGAAKKKKDCNSIDCTRLRDFL